MQVAKRVAKELKRLAVDLFIILLLFCLYTTRFYEHLHPPLQLVSLKMLLVSIGFTHCHIVRKLAFKGVEWDGNWTPRKVLIIVLYAVFIYAYSQGG
jgi:hypothetical protein